MNELLCPLLLKNANPTAEDAISFLIYLASSTEQIIAKTNVEIISRITKRILNILFSTNASEYLKILDENDKQASIHIGAYVISISNKWYFQMILLNSLRDARFIDFDNTESDIFISKIISYLLKYFQITKPHSLNFLKTLLYILSKRIGNVLDPKVSLEIINHMHYVALSPIHGFRQHAQAISKICLTHLSNSEKEKLCILENLPIRHIEMHDVLTLISKDIIQCEHDVFIKKSMECFHKNIDNKDGGILYAKVIAHYSFLDWTNIIWPLMMDSLKCIDEDDGEFFQSLIKYWIPYNVQQYSVNFYEFLIDKEINVKIKAYSLLETVKKGHTFTADVHEHITFISNNIETADIGLRIASTYFKKSLCPNNFEVNIIMNYLYANLNEFLDDDVRKSYQLFFSQLFSYAHCDLAKKKNNNCSNLIFYQDILNRIYKYCCSCLDTEFFEVGVQILQIVLDTLKGSYRKLLLNYKLEKKDFYEDGENRLYKHLIADNKWQFNNELFLWKIKYCFTTRSYSNCLTKLLIEHYKEVKFICVENMEHLLQNIKEKASLKNTEMVINYSKVLLLSKNNENEIFIQKILNKLANFNEDNIFNIVVYFAIIDNALKLDYEILEIATLINSCLNYISIMIDKEINKEDYATVKSFESLIIMFLNTIIHNIDQLWPRMDKNNFINTLIKIIHCSNMKKPVQASADTLKRVALQMDDAVDEDVSMKIMLLDETLRSIHRVPSLDLKIRRNPESRLVIHALCSAEKIFQKPLLNWSMSSLLNFILSGKCSDIAIARALHCLEILVADNTLYNQTLPYIPDIIVNCVELFARNNWIIRNADLQLAKSIIDRFYGVCLGLCDRPKCVVDLFQLFPQLMGYFFKILNADTLDDRASMVFQFFSESQIKQKTTKFLNYFKILFMSIIKHYPHQYGKFAVKSYVAICYFEDIPSDIRQIVEYIECNYRKVDNEYFLPSNILTNLIFLLQELFEKYKNSTKPEKLPEIHSYLKHFQCFLRKLSIYTPLYDYILVKVIDAKSIRENFSNMNNNRLWLHNNLPYLVINAKFSDLPDIIDMLLSSQMVVCFKIKVLSILVSKFASNCFDSENLRIILNILFKNAFSSEDNEYLSLCYFKVISLFYQNINRELFKPEMALVVTSSNLHKAMISFLYVSNFDVDDSTVAFYKSALDIMISSIGINEETNNDIMSTIFYFKIDKTSNNVQICLKLFKIVFYCSIFYSTYIEAYRFISFVTRKRYKSMLEALNDFLQPATLLEFIKDENQINIFYNDLNAFYCKAYKDDTTDDGYYSIDTDNLIPKKLMEKLLLNVQSKFKNMHINK